MWAARRAALRPAHDAAGAAARGATARSCSSVAPVITSTAFRWVLPTQISGPTSEPTKMSHSFHQCSYLSIWPKMAAFTSPKTIASRRWRGRTFVGGGLSLRQTDPTHLRSIGQRLERLGRFVVRQTGKIRVRRSAHIRWRCPLKKQARPAGVLPAISSTLAPFHVDAVVLEVAKTHRRDTGVARCAPCAGELVAASMAYRTRVKTVVAVRQTAAESR